MNRMQCRMARAGLGWSSARLARVSGVPLTTLNGYVLKGHDLEDGDVALIRTAFEAHGVVFSQSSTACIVRIDCAGAKPLATSGPATDAVKAMDEAIHKDKI